jgi:hypothetical protein
MDTLNDFHNISKSIENELNQTIDYTYDFCMTFIDKESFDELIMTSITKLDNLTTQVNSLIQNKQLNEFKYHQDVTILYNRLKQYDTYNFISYKFANFYGVYDWYITHVVNPYTISLIRETINVLKDQTPIVDDNICDILSFLNDEKLMTKHQVDSEIYN